MINLLKTITDAESEKRYPEIWVTCKGREKEAHTGLLLSELLQLANAGLIRYAMPEIKPAKIVFWLPDLMTYLDNHSQKEPLAEEYLAEIASSVTGGRPALYQTQKIKEFLREALKGEQWSNRELTAVLTRQFKCSARTAALRIKELFDSGFLSKKKSKQGIKYFLAR